ncbi:hypothetical protein [Embleya sp. NBC_00896]|uniref:hypothetical protein n=1 Tax=Embleya sp. NBC_00896 TaxID=2975961 RepID=UPI002F90A562|nr:hypothetical protein OG928_46580 [Embleya sp. NBC_00896]
MSRSPLDPPAADEVVTFIQHQLPGLRAGAYEVRVDQRVNDAGGASIAGDTLTRSYRFGVVGDRLRLTDPGATIASTFPADNASGDYGTVFAHVVFANTSFPWARSPMSEPPADPETGVDVPTWLAVLVLDGDDVAAHPGLVLEPVTRRVRELFPAALGTTIHSYFDRAGGTPRLDVGETPDDPVQTIDIPLDLFVDIAPALEDLAFSAHVRRVAVENKPLTLGSRPAADPLGSFSIVVANRLPQPDTRSHAYLVSLEGLENFLPATDQGGSPRNPTADTGGSLRLAVLHHWSFDSTGDIAAFVDRLKRLNSGDDPPNTTLRLVKEGAAPPISGALAGGYVPLDHELRTGENTVSWYRGPLSPVGSVATPIELPITSPDQAMVFDPTTGMFDVSLSAAWTIGRLVALQDKSFANALYAWKRDLARSVVDGVERSIVDDALAGLLPAPSMAAEESAPAVGIPLLWHTMRLLGLEEET